MKKTKLLALVLILAFASLGGAYALVKDQLNINATVNTAIVDVVWVDPASSDTPYNYTGYPSVVDVNKYGSGSDRAVYNEGADGLKRLDRMDTGNGNDPKNIGYLDAKLAPEGDTNLEVKLPPYVPADQDPRYGGDLLTITLKNGYPGYQEYITAGIKNQGNIPVRFEVNPALSAPDENTLARKTDVGIADWLHVKVVNATNETIVYFDSANTGLHSPLEDKPLNPLNSGGKIIPVKIITRVLNDAPQKTTTSFTLQLRAIQWNEYGFTVHDQITQPD